MPFDFGVMECGQYNENWHPIHMYPEESVQAALDAHVKCALPVHCQLCYKYNPFIQLTDPLLLGFLRPRVLDAY